MRLILQWCCVIPSLTWARLASHHYLSAAPRAVFNLHQTSGWRCPELQGKWTPLHLPGGFHKLISWHSGCWLKNQQIFLFQDAFGLYQCLLTPLFLMFHYAPDQLWQPKPNLIRTVYSLNEWSSHLLTSLPFSPRCTLQHLAGPVVAARAFLIQ